ncbi:hypothetical protein BRC65_07505, partial [Halobacteriales archaeon QH_2_65_14]
MRDAGHASVARRDGEALVEATAEVMSFDEEAGDIRPVTTSHVYRGSTDRLVRVRTASGRELEVTPAHKLFRMGGDLRVAETPAEDLEVGDSLVTPRQTPVDGTTADVDPYELLPEARVVEDDAVETVRTAIERAGGTKKALAADIGVTYDVFMNYALGRTSPTLSFVADVCEELGVDRPAVGHVKPGSNGKPVSIPETVDAQFGEFLGLVLSDGVLTERTVRFYNTDRSLRERFGDLAAELFDVAVAETVHNTVETVEVRSTVVASLLSALGVPETNKSVTASVPEAVLTGPEEVTAAFLRGYYLGDGSFSRGTVEIATSSDGMASDLSYLLARFGVLVRARSRETGHRVIVSGAGELDRLCDAVGREGHEKIERVASYARTTTGNTNVDTVPVGSKTMLEIAEAASG